MRVIDLAHEGHQGIVRTKQLLRVDKTCKSGITCLASTPKRIFEPVANVRITE